MVKCFSTCGEKQDLLKKKNNCYRDKEGRMERQVQKQISNEHEKSQQERSQIYLHMVDGAIINRDCKMLLNTNSSIIFKQGCNNIKISQYDIISITRNHTVVPVACQ